MRRTTLVVALLCAPLLLLQACAGSQVNSNAPASPTPAATPAAQTVASATPPAQVVTASAEEVRLAAGGKGEAVVRLDIKDGFHVNANPPSDRFYIGTELTVEPAGGVTPGKPVYPRAVMQKFQFAEKPLAVYEGITDLKLPLKAERSAPKGAHTLPARIRVQPCNDQECFPPRTIETSIPVVVE